MDAESKVCIHRYEILPSGSHCRELPGKGTRVSRRAFVTVGRRSAGPQAGMRRIGDRARDRSWRAWPQ